MIFRNSCIPFSKLRSAIKERQQMTRGNIRHIPGEKEYSTRVLFHEELDVVMKNLGASLCRQYQFTLKITMVYL